MCVYITYNVDFLVLHEGHIKSISNFFMPLLLFFVKCLVCTLEKQNWYRSISIEKLLVNFTNNYKEMTSNTELM